MGSKTNTSKKVLKKQVRQKVYDKLVVALAEFKNGVKDKKFEKKLRRTSKLFAVDLIKSNKADRTPTAKVVTKKTEDSVQKTA